MSGITMRVGNGTVDVPAVPNGGWPGLLGLQSWTELRASSRSAPRLPGRK